MAGTKQAPGSSLRRAAVAFAIVVAMSGGGVLHRASAAEAGPFAVFAGTWNGSGEITLSDGHKEAIRCRAIYNPSANGAALSDSLRCASDSYNFDLSSELTARGSSLSGSWKETTKGVDGQLSGTIAKGQMKLQAQGPNFSAGLGLASNGGRQEIQIRSDGSQFAAVKINLRRQ